MAELKENQDTLADRVGKILEEFREMRDNEDNKLREISRDFDTKFLYKKEKMSPLFEEKLNRLQELAMATRDQLEMQSLEVSKKLALFSSQMLQAQPISNDGNVAKEAVRMGNNFVQYADFQFTQQLV